MTRQQDRERERCPSDWHCRRIPLEQAALFKGRCGHSWTADSGGWFACPTCGDHHLVSFHQLTDLLPDDPEKS
ncbi:MAG: hypothetical protein ACRD2Z_09625 [Thermoanaerobaculia bacterium]